MSEVPDGAALIVGGSGGIGTALAAELSRRGRYQLLLSGQRGTGEVGLALNTPLERLFLDLEEPESLQEAAGLLRERLDESRLILRSLYICSGILHAPDIRPERRIADLEAEAFERVLRINALGPLLIARHFLPLLPRQAPSRLAAISARVGSISDNHLGGWYSYRCSKAALNMGFRTLQIELARSHPQCVLTLFHPGTTASALSEPFQANVPPEKLFTPRRSAEQFCEVLGLRDHGELPLFADWAGQGIDY